MGWISVYIPAGRKVDLEVEEEGESSGWLLKVSVEYLRSERFSTFNQ